MVGGKPTAQEKAGIVPIGEQIKLSNATRKRLTLLIPQILERRAKLAEAVAGWSGPSGALHLDAAGFSKVNDFADELLKIEAVRTSPKDYLRNLIAHSIIDFAGDPALAVGDIERKLNDSLGEHLAFVPLWGFHLADGVHIKFGAYEIQKLGMEGFANDVLRPFREMRAALGEEQVANDVTRVEETFKHVPNAPVLSIAYSGSKHGAKDVVTPIAERVAGFIQFLIMPLVSRDGISIIDHRGAYFGRFSNYMPVLSFDPNTSEMQSLGRSCRVSGKLVGAFA